MTSLTLWDQSMDIQIFSTKPVSDHGCGFLGNLEAWESVAL